MNCNTILFTSRPCVQSPQDHEHDELTVAGAITFTVNETARGSPTTTDGEESTVVVVAARIEGCRLCSCLLNLATLEESKLESHHWNWKKPISIKNIVQKNFTLNCVH